MSDGREKRTRLMKRGVQVVFTIAWLPIVWLFLSASAGRALAAIVPVAWMVQLFLALVSLLLILLAYRALSSLVEKIFDAD